MLINKIGGSPLFLFKSLSRHKEIVHFISSRVGGVSSYPYNSLNLAFHVGDSHDNVLRNREIVASCLGITAENLTFARQVHGDNVTVVGNEMKGKGLTALDDAIDSTDAMITDNLNICLIVLVADCVALLLFDPKRGVVGIVHAGWRGTLRGIAQKIINSFINRFGSEPGDIIVGISPSIGPCCYEVDQNVISQLVKKYDNEEDYLLKTGSKRGFLNLLELNKIQLKASGIHEENIEVAGLCTKCRHDIFFSYRYQGDRTGRFAAGIMLKGSV